MLAQAPTTARVPGASDTVAPPVSCAHCGTRCATRAFSTGDRPFCCAGCRTVFELLHENGLGEFYSLSETAGVRISRAAGGDQLKFLDEPAVRERLVDFADARMTRVTFHIPAIHCIACVWLLENLFRLNPAIGQSRVNFPRQEVSLAFDTAQVKLSEVVTLLASLGYEPELKFSDLERPAGRTSRRLWLQIGLAGFAFGNAMLFSIATYLGLDAFSGPTFRQLTGWISLVLALPVVTYSALDYWRSAWISLRQRLLNIDVPIAAGIVAIFAQSTYEVVTGRGEGYFDSLCGLLFFLLLGKLFQQKTYDRLAFDRDYKSFFPLSVTRLGGAGCPQPAADGAMRTSRPTTEEHVSLAQLAVGDRLVLRNGELIPADVRLIEGPALIDYSFVTGESEPVEKQAGDYLYAGGRQIGGAIEIETVKAVSQSYLTSLWNQDAFRKDKAESFNALTNDYSQRFTKIVIAVALGSAAYWAWANPTLSLKAFTSVLIVACPCALALAAPFALGTAQRVLGRRQVYLKNPYVLETLAQVDAVVFDKTGTLTAAGAGSVTWAGASQLSLTPGFSRVLGTPTDGETVSTVSRRAVKTDESVFAREGTPDTGLKPGVNEMGRGSTALTEAEERWLYSMTRHSTHPLPVRIGEAIAREHFPDPVRSFLETAGCGMEGSVAGHEIWMGSAAWIGSRNSPVPPQQQSAGSTVHVAIDGKYRGAYVLASALRPDADALIRKLSSGYDLALLSGDNERERAQFTALFGANAYLEFNQSPLNKLGFIRNLQQSGKTTMMVGDGLNDAGALKQSDVGVAVAENVTAFSPASDIIMAAGRVPQLAGVLRFSKQSVRVVRGAFLISAVYNVVGVAIAASGHLSPVVCAILMPVSSITVVAFACGVTTWLGRDLDREEARP